MKVLELKLTEIEPNADNPRRDFPAQHLVDLAEDIKKNGQRNPILVSLKDGKYYLIAGECRIRAFRLNGDQTIMASVYNDLSEEAFDTLAIQDNIFSLSLSPIETGIALLHAQNKHKRTQEDISKRMGKCQKWVSNSLSLVKKIVPEVQELIRNKTLKQSFARLLKRVPRDRQKVIADYIVQNRTCMSGAEFYIKQQLDQSTITPDVRRLIAVFSKGAFILGQISARYSDQKQELPKGLASELSKACLEYSKVKDHLTMWILHSASKDQDAQSKSN